MEYEWDEGKRASNRAKHGVDFAEVQRFEWDSAVEAVDARLPYGEIRWKAIGFIGTRLHLLIYTKRGGRTRLISLRKANRKEKANYEAAN